MKTITEKILELGGSLADPATDLEVSRLESKLGADLPDELRQFLLSSNGSAKETKDGMWRMWPCDEITTYERYRNVRYFVPDNNDLREIDPTARGVTLPGANLVLFGDALIDASIYGVFLSPGSPYHGFVFDAAMGYVSSLSFHEWTIAFIDRAEDVLLFPSL